MIEMLVAYFIFEASTLILFSIYLVQWFVLADFTCSYYVLHCPVSVRLFILQSFGNYYILTQQLNGSNELLVWWKCSLMLSLVKVFSCGFAHVMLGFHRTGPLHAVMGKIVLFHCVNPNNCFLLIVMHCYLLCLGCTQ